jgi:hypothetical protein
MPVAILGDRSCGKTVFLALLYHTQVWYSNKQDQTKKDFLHYETQEHASAFIDITNAMLRGFLPDPTMKKRLFKYRFKYGYRRPVSKGMDPEDKYYTIDFSVYDIAGEEQNVKMQIDQYNMKMGLAGNQSFDISNFSEDFKKLLDCNVLVFIVDVTKINYRRELQPGETSSPYDNLLEYDKFMTVLVSLLSQYKSRVYAQDKRKAKIFPVFFFTKFDQMDRSKLSEIGLPDDYTVLEGRRGKIGGLIPGKKEVTVDEFGRKLMASYFPNTYSMVIGSRLVNANYADARFFISEMRMGLSPTGKEAPMRAKFEGREDLDYSREQYVRFIESFRDIAKDMGAELRSTQEFDSEGV